MPRHKAVARLAAGGAFTYKLFVTAVIISTTVVRVASTKADLNISKVVFRLDDGHVVIKVIPSPVSVDTMENKKRNTGINYRVQGADPWWRHVKNLNCSIACAFHNQRKLPPRERHKRLIADEESPE